MAFHWKHGWYFERLPMDGSVRIFHKDLDIIIDIDPDSWASIVASVSNRGDTAKAFEEARDFHHKQ